MTMLQALLSPIWPSGSAIEFEDGKWLTVGRLDQYCLENEAMLGVFLAEASRF